jgi:predicted patatin/cPLA2 family phospholipase
VLEGGGMRGVVSAAMAAAVERLGLTASFDLVVGSSAGAINGGALVAGVARGCAAAYYGPFASRSFVNPARVLWGRPVMSVDYALAYDAPDLDAERHQRAVESPIELHCVAVDVATAAAVDLSGMRTKQELCDAILASSRMPGRAARRCRSATGASSTAAWPRRSRRRGARRRGHARPRAARRARTTCRARATRGWPIASSSATCASSTPRS